MSNIFGSKEDWFKSTSNEIDIRKVRALTQLTDEDVEGLRTKFKKASCFLLLTRKDSFFYLNKTLRKAR